MVPLNAGTCRSAFLHLLSAHNLTALTWQHAPAPSFTQSTSSLCHEEQLKSHMLYAMGVYVVVACLSLSVCCLGVDNSCAVPPDPSVPPSSSGYSSSCIAGALYGAACQAPCLSIATGLGYTAVCNASTPNSQDPKSWTVAGSCTRESWIGPHS